MKDKVTVVMTTFNNWDFTRACAFAFKEYYPDIRIIFADGGSTDGTATGWNKFADDMVMLPDGKIEDCRNAAAAIVDTPFILTMDNDTKVIGKEALPLLLEVMEEKKDAAETGAYCVKVIHEFRRDYCSRVFNATMECDWCPAYFTLHRTKAWREVGGQPKEYYYMQPPFERSEKAKRYNNGGDASIAKYYQKAGWKIYTPRKEVPVLHFVRAAWWNVRENEKSSNWWRDEFEHNPTMPLNDWEKYETEKIENK